VTALREVVHELVARHGIPGAVVGVLEDGRVVVQADRPDNPPYAYGIGDDGTGHARWLFLMDQLARRIGDA
jgi:hypothetical protein